MEVQISEINCVARAAPAGSLLAAMAMLWLAPAHAAWDVVPEIGLLVDNNDNPRLEPADPDDASRSVLDARVTLSNFGERGNIFVEPRVRANAYADDDDEDLENDDAFFRSYGQYGWQTVTAGFYAEFQQRSIQSSEFRSASPADPDLPPPPDLGTGQFVFLNQEQDSTWFSPFVDYKLSGRSNLRFEYQDMDVSYSGPSIRERGDFRDKRVYGGMVRHVDTRTDVAARMFVGTFEGDVNRNETDTAGVEGRFSRPINEIWSFTFGAGVQRSDFRYFDDNNGLIDNATSNVVANIEFRQRSELRTLNVRVGRDIYPSGTGFLAETNQLSLYVDQRFSPRVSGRFGLRYDDIVDLDEVRTIDERDYARLELEFRWAMTMRVSLLAGYQFTAQGFGDSPDSDAESNAVYFGINYRGLSRAPQ
jgi:hypothetical protein